MAGAAVGTDWNPAPMAACWAANDETHLEADSLLIGRTVAQYRIVERLGEGSMGVVFRAEDALLKRSVALKFLPLEVAGDVAAKQRFLREAQAASRLDHPNICTIHEIGETSDGQLFIVMAHYEGETLKKRLARGRLGVREATEIAWRIARGLARAHAQDVVHRDVKPANVLLTADGGVKILDFGLAKVAGEAALTHTGSSIGTPLYMSPEQIGGDSDARADVWSLGVLLYEMLTGARPFGGGSSATTMYAILHRAPAPLAQHRPGLPPSLQRIVARALEKDVDRRYASAAEMADDLADAVSDEMSATQPMLEISGEDRAPAPTGSWGVGRRPGGRRFGWHLAAAALVVAALVSAVVFLRPGASVRRASIDAQAATAARRVAVLPFSFRGGDELAYLEEGMVDLLATKLDGAGDLRSVDPRALLGHLGNDQAGISGSLDPVRAAAIGQRFGADMFILGNIVEVAGLLRFDARLYSSRDPEAELVAATAEGAASEIFTLVDRLASGLLVALPERTAGREQRLAAITTESFPALKAYLEGESAHRAGRFEDAARALQTAVDVDPDFALAWYRLSVVAEWMVEIDRAAEAARQAEQHAGRLGERDHQLVTALAAYIRGDAGEAERIYREILRRHPDHLEAWYRLGEVEFHYGPLDGRSRRRSRRSWEKVVEYEPADLGALLHLSRLDLYERDFEALSRRADRLEPLLAGTAQAREVLFYRASLPDGESARARMEAAARGASVSLSWMPASFFIGSSMGDPGLWLPTLNRLLEGERPVHELSYGHKLAGVLQLALGRLAAADAQLEQASTPPEMAEEYRALAATVPHLPVPRERLAALAETVDRWSTAQATPVDPMSPIAPHAAIAGHLRAYVAGLLAARLGRSALALARAAELEDLGDLAHAPGLHLDLAAGVRAEVARQTGDSARVLELLAERHGRYSYQLAVFSPVYSQARERWLKAEALFDLGRLEEADAWYETLSELNLFDLAYLAWSHLRRAEICTRLGRPDAALDHHQRVVGLWRDADPELRQWVIEAEAELRAAGRDV